MANATNRPIPEIPAPGAVAVLRPVGGRDRGAGPVVAAERGFDRIAAQAVGVAGANPGRRARQEGIGAIRSGDSQDRVLVAQVARLPGAFGPVDRALPGERVDVDHPQPDMAVVVELVDGLFHVGAVGKPLSMPAESVT